MSRYLDRLKALANSAEKHLPKNPTKLTEGAFVGGGLNPRLNGAGRLIE